MGFQNRARASTVGMNSWGLGRCAGATCTSAAKVRTVAGSAGGLRRSPAPYGVCGTNVPAALSAVHRGLRCEWLGPSAVCTCSLRVWAHAGAPACGQLRRWCSLLTSLLSGRTGGQTDSTFCQFNDTVRSVVSDLSVKDTCVFCLFGGVFLRAPLNPCV